MELKIDNKVITGNVNEMVELPNKLEETDGTWVDISTIPTFPGDDIVESIKRWLNLKENGIINNIKL